MHDKSHAHIAVVSRTFSGTPELAEELGKHFSNITWNRDRKLSGSELAAFIGGSEGAIVALEPVTDDVLAACPNLTIISKFGVGLDNIDRAACEKHGVEIGWTGGINRRSVAEMTLGFMLALCRNLFMTSYELKQGTWDKNGGRDLSGRTVGIVGVGNVGKEVIRLLKPFGCEILVNDIVDQHGYYAEVGVTEVSLEELLNRANIVTLHVPLTPKTSRMLNAQTLGMMKRGSYLINTARGGIIDYAALKQALKDGTLAGAALDVYDEEPPQNSDLVALSNVITTPHIGGNSEEAVRAMGMSAIEHVVNHFA